MQAGLSVSAAARSVRLGASHRGLSGTVRRKHEYVDGESTRRTLFPREEVVVNRGRDERIRTCYVLLCHQRVAQYKIAIYIYIYIPLNFGKQGAV